MAGGGPTILLKIGNSKLLTQVNNSKSKIKFDIYKSYFVVFSRVCR